ncbi:agamous-like MADS-box protein AGL23 [Vitis vinifera]|uniref:agamous-like MADS-box protein AGL23 n=1 Tax=Vitis vinifera TaxID=29760 RepID=UPI00053F618B|nr:agamous-like MADS-box protein AGL23 [Vitis vinifera]|eukprot:XP_010655803.1 PREDICTED: agamous-like MADS-box protein AGL23 [Vitis vinifera]
MEVANVNSQKKNMGRRKIEIRKIEKKSFLEVTFSKCQTGLFKKVGKLCVLCGAEAVVIVFSLGGRAFVFDHPIVKAVIDHFLKCDTDTSSCTMPIVDARSIGVRSSLRYASHSFWPTIGELGELLPCTKDVRTGGPGTPLRNLS